MEHLVALFEAAGALRRHGSEGVHMVVIQDTATLKACSIFYSCTAFYGMHKKWLWPCYGLLG